MENITSALTQLQLRMTRLRTAADADGSDGSDGSVAALNDFESALEHLRQAQDEIELQRSQLRIAADSAEEERRHVDSLFAEAAAALLSTDSDGVIREANRSACAMFGVSDSGLVGKPLSTFVRDDDEHGLDRALDVLEHGGELRSWGVVLAPRGRPALRGGAQVRAGRGRDGELELRWRLRAVPDGRPPDSAEASVVQAAAALHGVSGAALVIFVGESVTAASSDALSALACVQVETSQGPAHDACATGVAIAEGDVSGAGSTRWGAWSEAARAVPIGAVLSVPVVSGGAGIGALELYRGSAGAFDGSVLTGAAALAALIGATEQMRGRVGQLSVLTEQLQHALESRVLVEQAKGVLSERLKIAPEQAFEVLRHEARSTRRKLREIAEQTLTAG